VKLDQVAGGAVTPAWAAIRDKSPDRDDFVVTLVLFVTYLPATITLD
jgi:hypothetical protein